MSWRRRWGFVVPGAVFAATFPACGTDPSNLFGSTTDLPDASLGAGGGSSGDGAVASGGDTGGSGRAGMGGAGRVGAGGVPSAGGATVGSGGAGSGGRSGTGGAAGAGAGGTGGAAGGCAPPADKSQTAVCVTLAPESIKAESEPGLDEKGALIIQIFDTPTPPAADASKVALMERLVPANPGTSEVALDAIPMQRLVGTFPATAYVRAVFIDNAALLTPGTDFGWGSWVGGVDVTDGFQDNEPLLAVKLGVGEGNPVSLPLVALRKLTVTVSASAKPVGDGQGPLTAVVVDDSDVTKKPPAFGLAQAKCADVAAGDVTLTGFVVGKGPYWITGALDDLGLPGDFPPGTMAAIDVKPSKITIPEKLTFGAQDYSMKAQIDLSYVVPLAADAGQVPPNSCADLSNVPDGGP